MTMPELKHIRAAYRVSVKGLIYDNNGKLLFVRERSDTWDLPGGGLEQDRKSTRRTPVTS